MIDSKKTHLAKIPFKNLERSYKLWRNFPKFVTKIQRRCNQNNSNCDQIDGTLEKYRSVGVTLNILQVAIITGKNHILEMLINHTKDPATIDDYVEYIASPDSSSEELKRSSISVSNALHFAARFNPEALYLMLDKANLDTEKAKKDFWEKASKKSGFSPLQNFCLNGVSTR